MPKKDKPHVSRLNATHRAMIQLDKETMHHTIAIPNENMRFYEIFFNELSKDIVTIMKESKITFFKGLIIGASFGVLGNFLVASVFRVVDSNTDLNKIYFITSLVCLFICIWVISRKVKGLEEGTQI